jgi:HEAT repeat protein
VVLRAARKEPDVWLRRNAQRCIAAAAAAGETEVVPVLVEFLGDEPNYWPNGAGLFDGLGSAGAAAVPALVSILRGKDDKLRTEAMRALLFLGTVALPAAEAVIKRLRAGKQDAPFAVAVLGNLGAAVPGGLPLILKALDATDFGTRWQAWYALKIYRPRSDIPLRPLIEKLSDTDDWVRKKAAELLGLIGPPAARAVPALRKALGHSSKPVQKAAQSALQRIERR